MTALNYPALRARAEEIAAIDAARMGVTDRSRISDMALREFLKMVVAPSDTGRRCPHCGK